MFNASTKLQRDWSPVVRFVGSKIIMQFKNIHVFPPVSNVFSSKLSTYITLYIKLSGLQEKYGPKNHTVHTVNCWGKYGPALPLYNIPVSDCCLEYGLWTPLGTHSSGIRILGHHISSYTLANRLRLSTVCSIFWLHYGSDC